jgi:hypothetical protein
MADQNETEIDVAIRFMAQQPGGAERVLAIHRRLPDGRCRGCLTTVTMWPCPVARFAIRAQQSEDHHRGRN